MSDDAASTAADLSIESETIGRMIVAKGPEQTFVVEHQARPSYSTQRWHLTDQSPTSSPPNHRLALPTPQGWPSQPCRPHRGSSFRICTARPVLPNLHCRICIARFALPDPIIEPLGQHKIRRSNAEGVTDPGRGRQPTVTPQQKTLASRPEERKASGKRAAKVVWESLIIQREPIRRAGSQRYQRSPPTGTAPPSTSAGGDRPWRPNPARSWSHRHRKALLLSGYHVADALRHRSPTSTSAANAT